MIPYGKHQIHQSDIDSIVEVLQGESLTQGPKVVEFEQSFAKYIGANYAVAVSNGTAALHLSVLSLGLKPGDKVITSPISFAASANCIRYCGGEVIFADIDEDTYLLDLQSVREILIKDKQKEIKGILVIDFAGRPVDLKKFKQLADEFGCWLLEDACHAPGGYFVDSKGNPHQCGNGKFADLAIFSFHPVKHIAAGEGGMITTNNENMYRSILKLRNHGITKNPKEFLNENMVDQKGNFPEWYMEMQELGFNYRLSDLHAALGISQLKRANQSMNCRREIANRYRESFKNISQIIDKNDVIGHAYHLYIIELENREFVYKKLRLQNIFTQVHYFPIHLMPYYQKLGWKNGDFKVAESYSNKCISLPMYPTLTSKEQNFVIQTLISLLNP
jgi:UDP-4-amino-4,6-dideoxy-N-acetyl-beta-L-altrosamine transaminase